MEIDGVLEDPTRRRMWILTKALETLPLMEALRLAQAVEDFLLAPNDAEPASGDGNPCRPSEVGAIHHAERSRFAAQESRSPAGEKYSTPATPENASGEGAPRSASGAIGVDELDEAPGTASVPDDLAVLASPDDIVRYLRQRDDVVVRDGELYLVNGRFRESLGQLAERANRTRARQGLPLFQLVPIGFTPAATDGMKNSRGA